MVFAEAVRIEINSKNALSISASRNNSVRSSRNSDLYRRYLEEAGTFQHEEDKGTKQQKSYWHTNGEVNTLKRFVITVKTLLL